MTHAFEIHGRDADLALIRAKLECLGEGAGAVVIVEGGAGMGKSRLLTEVQRMGRSLGVATGSSAAEPDTSVVELAALLSALFDGHEPLLDRRELPNLRALPDQRFWLLQDLQQVLERAALEAPIMISIDDVQWADSGTAAALRILSMQLAGFPIAWVIAVRPSQGSAELVSTLELLRRNGAATVSLGPLESGAVAELAAEVLRADPDEATLDLIGQAHGSPFLLVEMLLGLWEEGRIRVAGGQAELVDGRLPDRVREGMRERVARLSEASSNAVTVAASLGRTFSFSQLARTIGVPPSTLISPVAELIQADLLVEQDDELSFWHDITREAVRASVPVSVRRALDRQAADVLLASGALPVEVALQLEASAEQGDAVAIVTLLKAAQALATTDPTTAARFGQRALEISSNQHPRRGEIVATTAIALHIAGNSEEARAFADTALRETLPAEQEAEVRLSIAGMFAISPDVRAGAGRLALALPDLSKVLRARHLACLVHNLMVSGRLEEAHEILEEARSAVASSRDGRAAFTLTFAEMAIEYSDGQLGRALELTVSARREGAGMEDDTRLRLAHMWHGEVLSDLDRYDEAFAIAADGLVSAERDRQEWTYQNFETWHARMLFETGRLSEAAVALERRFGGEDGTRSGGVLDIAGIVVLGQIAIHAGDTRQVRRVNDIAQVIWQRGTPAVRRHAAWLLSLIATSEGDYAAARHWIHAPFEHDGRQTLPRYPIEVTDEIQLARIARAAQDDQLASLALANARNRHDLNPNITSIAATYAHVRGLLGGSMADLEAAATLFEHSPRRLAYASALEDFGAGLATTARGRAIEVLGDALAVYTQAGADRDARRVRGRLRQLGVRRRIVSSETAENGWAAMTVSELSVALLVAEGLTNREVAERLFVSPHTVNSHLRNIFQKLGINSRVELARLAGENG